MPPTPTVTQALQVELGLLGASEHDGIATQAMRLAARLDGLTEADDPHVTHGLVRRLNELMLALQHPYWQHGGLLPAYLHEAMRRRAAATNARVPIARGRARVPEELRPAGITLSLLRDRGMAGDGW